MPVSQSQYPGSWIISHIPSDIIRSLQNRLLIVEGQLAKMGASAFQSSLFRDALLRDPRLSPTVTSIWHRQLMLLEDFLARMPLQVVLQPTSIRVDPENAAVPSEYPAALLFLSNNISNSSNPTPPTPATRNPAAPLHFILKQSDCGSPMEVNPYYEWSGRECVADAMKQMRGGVDAGHMFNEGMNLDVGRYANTAPAAPFAESFQPSAEPEMPPSLAIAQPRQYEMDALSSHNQSIRDRRPTSTLSGWSG